MKTIILLLTFILAFTKGHAQQGWYDEEQEKIPDKFVRYDTVFAWFYNIKERSVCKCYEITRYTHHFPAITENGNPVYWTSWSWYVDDKFRPLDYKFAKKIELK